MTYCVAAAVNDGLVFVSDSRTHGGVGNLGTYSKMRWFFGDGARLFVLLAAGNLATTQAVFTNLQRNLKTREQPNLATVVDLEDGAECVGAASVEEQQRHRGPDNNFLPDATFIFGGQIAGQEPGIYMIYREGNFVRASEASPYLQIGEVKYGKPILDRIITPMASLNDAMKCALVSMDSTMRSNATVGPPVEALIYRAGTQVVGAHHVLHENDSYLSALRDGWNERINAAFKSFPDPVHELDPQGTVRRIDR